MSSSMDKLSLHTVDIKMGSHTVLMKSDCRGVVSDDMTLSEMKGGHKKLLQGETFVQ